MPFQPSTRELVSVDNWYQLGNSSPTTTEVLFYTLLVELVLGTDREAFMGAVEAEKTPNTVPQDGEGEGVWRAPSTLTHYKGGGPVHWEGAVQLQQGRCPGYRQGIGNLPGTWEAGWGVALRQHPHLSIVPQERQAVGACSCWHKVQRSKESGRGASTDCHDDESQR